MLDFVQNLSLNNLSSQTLFYLFLQIFPWSWVYNQFRDQLTSEIQVERLEKGRKINQFQQKIQSKSPIKKQTKSQGGKLHIDNKTLDQINNLQKFGNFHTIQSLSKLLQKIKLINQSKQMQQIRQLKMCRSEKLSKFQI